MNNKRYRWILYTIVAVILTTIVIQFYWNYKNYLSSKQQLINDVQVSLDKAVDDYYADLAAKTTLSIFLSSDAKKQNFQGNSLNKFIEKMDTISSKFKLIQGSDSMKIKGIEIFKEQQTDSIHQFKKTYEPISKQTFLNTIDSLKLKNGKLSKFEALTSKVVVSINNDTLNLNKVDSFLAEDLKRKHIIIQSKLLFYKDIETYINNSQNASLVKSHKLIRSESKSTFLPNGSTLEIAYTNPVLTILKRILGGITISLVLILTVISCLFYLLHIIKHQKQLSEVKNDLISNITHEFKTPIATIGVALESINSFDGLDDKVRTKKYLTMSAQQLDKLNIMVEKILETATLDSDNLKLNKDPVNVPLMLQNLLEKYKIQHQDKIFINQINPKESILHLDPFHFENALNNILDNAIKYGGTSITVVLEKNTKGIEIQISDNGNTLTKVQAERIFEKFYRVPKGNTHDVKGFGIGLYYTKTIIEKHNGHIEVAIKHSSTAFKITMPYE